MSMAMQFHGHFRPEEFHGTYIETDTTFVVDRFFEMGSAEFKKV
jgi:hypothetical protein